MRHSMILALALVALAAGAAPALAASARQEAFAPIKGQDAATPVHCTADRAWCAEINQDAASKATRLRLFTRVPDGKARPVLVHDLSAELDDTTYALWPSLIRLPDGGLLLGVKTGFATGYSGGGGSAATLELLWIKGAASQPVLTLPVSASIMIRACFGEKEMKARRGVCHDEYTFDATLTLAPPAPAAKAGGDLPTLIYQTQATSFPGHVSREGDSTTAPPLRKADIVKVRNARCSFRRVMTYDPDTGAYYADAPLPACSDFTEP